jgi:hypothetical protein
MSIQGLSDIATPAAQFARLSLPVRRVFVTENEINGLAFPAVPESIVVFGLGYGLDRLSEIPGGGIRKSTTGATSTPTGSPSSIGSGRRCSGRAPF